MSDKFYITNRTHQGCPLSPLIFSLLLPGAPLPIRQDTLIKGIRVANTDHKIGLFVDDVVLTLTSPASSLDRTQNLLYHFGRVSYYKLIVNKSSILPIHILTPNLKKLKLKFPFQWATKSLQYLGINLSYPSNSVFEHNYPTFLNTIKNDLAHILSHELTWLGKIAALKMTLLTKMIYYFQTIPICLPKSFFTTVDKMFRIFIWAGKLSRFSYPILLKHRQKGRMGFPNLLRYYYAALLDQAKSWFDHKTDKHWVHIEWAIVAQRDLPYPLLATLTHRPLYYPKFQN